jgi:hypothetical protein
MNRILVGVVFLLMLPTVYATNSIDIQNYDFNIHIFPTEHKFSARVVVDFKALEDVDRADFLLNKDISISRIVDEGGEELLFERKDNDLSVFLPETLHAGDSGRIVFEYSGVSDTDFQSGKFVWGYIGQEGSYMIYEAVWYPLIWGDRATARVSLTVPKGQTAVTVGELTEVLDGTSTVTYVWDTHTPTRGISFASGEYQKDTKTIFVKSCPHKFLEVTYYLYPEEFFRAEKSFRLSSDILEFYSSTFGCYPYQKFSVVEIPEFFYGGHGDQGLIMLSAGIFRKNPAPEFIAHEVAHNWWGALVFAKGEPSLRAVEKFSMILTPPKQIRAAPREQNHWLLEGFATYSGVMYLEEKYGHKDMISALEQKRKEYVSKVKELGDLPIVKVEEEYGGGLYHAVVYSKGALVLHMLRYVVGDDVFLNIMKSFTANYGGKSASVDDFQKVCEKVSGRNLGWFFDQWVKGTTLPDYAVGGVVRDGQTVKVKIIQKGNQTEMPIDVTLHTSEGDITKRIWMKNMEKEVVFKTSAKPISVEIDKDYWLLESDKSNNLYPISYPLNLEGIKLLLVRLHSLLDMLKPSF